MRARRSPSILGLAIFLAACSDAAAPVRPVSPPDDPLASLAEAGGVGVVNGVFVPPQVKPGQWFQASFTLSNPGTAPVAFAEVVAAVLKPDGTHLYDAARRVNVTVAPGTRWSLADSLRLLPTLPSGAYKVIARGRRPGGNWFNFAGQVAGVNPVALNVVNGPAFAAVVASLNVNPASVRPGERPIVTATIRNTSTSDTQWSGAATFIVRAAVRRNGRAVREVQWSQAFAAGETRTGFEIPPDYDTSIAGVYEVIYRVYSGDGVHLFAWSETAFWVEAAGAASCSAPPDALHRVSYTAFTRAPYGIKGATPWLAVVHDTRQSGTSRVEIDYIRLWARIGGVSRVVTADEYEDGDFGGETCARSPWFQPGSCTTPLPGTLADGALVIDPSTQPTRVWHPYLNTHPLPRADISGADSVWTEVRLRVTGPALVQVGLDYWRDSTYVGDRVVEASVTDWQCAQGSWQTVRLERSTEVADSIRLSTTPAGSAFRVGVPITGSFTLRNGDDDTVQILEAGLEVRRNNSGVCDPIGDRDPYAGGMAWAGSVALSPGASRAQSSSWTPSAAGTYCVTAVESRRTGSYQRTRLQGLFKPLVVSP